MSFEQTFKNIDDVLYKDAGADSELDYIEQTSWIMFLRYLEALEEEKKTNANLSGNTHEYILEEKYRWNNWAMPKIANGDNTKKLDHHEALTGNDLVEFVNEKLFPYLASFREKATKSNTIEYKIGEIFSELKNKIQSGYNLREILGYADELVFGLSKNKHELSHLYETKIKNMGNAGRNGGQYYTPRPLIKAIIKIINPQIRERVCNGANEQIRERVYDGACGSAGFLCEGYNFMYEHMKKSTDNLKILEEKTFFGCEKKNLAYVIGTMNMILHGIDVPNIVRSNTLDTALKDIQDRDRYEVILANPPFGGKERPEIQENFDIKTGETAFLFLQHFIKILKARGRAGIVIKNTFLSNTDIAATALRKHLLASCNLHTVLDMPSGTFQGAGVKTVVLFFTKGEPTKKIWYYQLNPGRSMGKTNPLNENDMADFITLQKTKPESPNSWMLSVANLNETTYDLSVKNPNAPAEKPLRSPAKIIAEMKKLDKQSNALLQNLKDLL